MHALKTSFQNNPNVGLHGYCAKSATRDLCLLGPGLQERKEVAEALHASVVHCTIAGTPMPGVFLAGNSRALLVPGIAFKREIEMLRKLGLPVKVFETNLTCLGNNIMANDFGCLVNPHFTNKEITELQHLLGVPVKRIEIAGVETPGACLVLNGVRGIIHRDAAEFEIDMVKATLGLEHLEPASVNLGSPYIKAGVLNTDTGFIVGDLSGGPEIVHIEQALGYMG